MCGSRVESGFTNEWYVQHPSPLPLDLVCAETTSSQPPEKRTPSTAAINAHNRGSAATGTDASYNSYISAVFDGTSAVQLRTTGADTTTTWVASSNTNSLSFVIDKEGIDPSSATATHDNTISTLAWITYLIVSLVLLVTGALVFVCLLRSRHKKITQKQQIRHTRWDVHDLDANNMVWDDAYTINASPCQPIQPIHGRCPCW